MDENVPVMLNVYVPASLRASIKSCAAKEGLNMSQWLNRRLVEAVAVGEERETKRRQAKVDAVNETLKRRFKNP